MPTSPDPKPVIDLLRKTAADLQSGKRVAVVISVDNGDHAESTIWGNTSNASNLVMLLLSGLLGAIAESRVSSEDHHSRSSITPTKLLN